MKYIITTTDEDDTENIRFSTTYFNTIEQALVIYQDQNKEATLVLVQDSSQWLYRENLRRPVKVTRSFDLGDNLDISDMLGIDLMEDYEITAEQIVDDVLLLEMNALVLGLRYRHVDIRIDPDNLDITGIDYKSVSNKVIRTADVEYTRLSGGRRMPSYTFYPSVVSRNQETVNLTVQTVEDSTLPVNLFAPNVTVLQRALDFLADEF